MKTLLIVPAYNEAENIPGLMDILNHQLPQDCDYIIINDGSADNTADLCRRYQSHMIDSVVNTGLSNVFQMGMLYAKKSGYDAAIQFDADGQHDAAYIAPMIEAMKREDADIVIGSRFVTESKPASLRMLGSTIIQFLIKTLYHKNVVDPTSGMRLYNRRMIERFASNINMDPEPDVLAYMINCKAKVCEVQVEMHDRTAGTSYLNFGRSIKYMLRIITSILFIQKFRSRRG